jgi:hypothetical protein
MTDQYLPEPDPRRPRRLRQHLRRLPRAAVVVGVAAVLAGGSAGVVFATSAGSSPSTANAASAAALATSGTKVRGPAPGRIGRRLRGPGGAFGLDSPGMLGGRVLHGEATVRTATGYKTVVFQAGEVTAVTPTSITVKSADGFSATYSVSPATVVDSQSGGISSVTAKDRVALLATAVGGKETASSIVDITKIRASRRSFGFGPPPASTSNAAPTGAGTAWSSIPGLPQQAA